MSRIWISFIGTVALALAIAPRSANACGGTFCDAMPFEPMPVDQQGEEILFAVDGGMVEVHIRIQYQGEAERFAWLVPLQGIPEVTIGSDALFTSLYEATSVDWYSVREYECEEDDPSWNPGDGDGDPGDGDGDGDGDGGPEIVLQKDVGAFEVLVLQGGTAGEVIDFLAANEYEQDPDAEPILQEYLDQGFLFAAIKLTASADVNQIHPLVFEFPGDEPCVPIRLTSIAATDDMDIRAYFLGDTGWAPTNYAHVVLNPLAYNWSAGNPGHYQDLVTAAVDEAGGQGFVTEFFGISDYAVSYDIWSPGWNSNAFVSVDPITALIMVVNQGLNAHPQIQPILLQFIPPPPNVDPLEFWNFPDAYMDQIDLDAWDGAMFAAAIEERIIQPGLQAWELLEQYPRLTALHTTMSPFEMTLDPTFHPIVGPSTNGTDKVVIERVLCGGHDSIFDVEIEDQPYPVCVPDNGLYPTSWGMPAALRIEQVPMVGPPQVVTDNLPMITEIHQTYQAGVACSSEEPGGTEGGGTSGGSESSGPGQNMSSDSGCACSASNDGLLGLGFAASMFGLLWLRRRREA